VATPVPLLVSAEVGAIDTLRWLGFLTTVWHWTRVTVLWMETVIDVTTEVVRAVEPWARPHEDTATKPFWSVIAGGRTAVGSGIVISIGTLRRYTDADAYAYLSLYRGNGDRKAGSNTSSQHDKFKSTHKKIASLIPSILDPQGIILTTAPPMSAASYGSLPFVFAPMIGTRIHGFSHLSLWCVRPAESVRQRTKGFLSFGEASKRAKSRRVRGEVLIKRRLVCGTVHDSELSSG
jgi:hypothetical protein